MTGRENNNGKDYFDNLGYNNQRHFLWCLVDVARANEQGREYDWTKFIYEHVGIVDSLPRIGSERLARMIQRLTAIGTGNKIKLQKLMEATA